MALGSEPILTGGSASAAPFRLTGTRVAEFFRFGCERQLRYDLAAPGTAAPGVPRPNRDPARGPRVGPRPGTALLVREGERWERARLRQLLQRFPAEQVRFGGWAETGDAARLAPEQVIASLRAPGALRVLIQPELQLADPLTLARRFGVDPVLVEWGTATPDLLFVQRSRTGRVRLRVADIKASRQAATAHFAQVAFYSLVLEQLCAEQEIAAAADVSTGYIWSRAGRGPRRFALGAYRHHVRQLLQRDLPRIVALEPDACAWHVSPRCNGCRYFEHCRAEADSGADLARVPGITAQGKQVLHEHGIHSVPELAGTFRKDIFEGSHTLEARGDVLQKRASALKVGKALDIRRPTQLLPPSEDVRILVTAEGDPVTGVCFALGLRTVAGGEESAQVFVAAAGTAAAEAAMAGEFAARLAAVLAAASSPAAPVANGAGRKGERRADPSLHLYVWDRTELAVLTGLVERQIAANALLPVMQPLGTLLAAAAAQGAAPASVLVDAVNALFALPVPYHYDLASVSAALRPRDRCHVYVPGPEYAWPFSSQIAFERVHNVWQGREHRPATGTRSAAEVLAEIRRLAEAKTAAMDSVLRALRERSARSAGSRARKPAFQPPKPEEPIGHPALETLRLFARMEAAADAVRTHALHALPAAERARRFECIRGLTLEDRAEDGTLTLSFDPECRDAKFRESDFNLVLTPDDGATLQQTDRELWTRMKLGVELVRYETVLDPPRVVLAPTDRFAKAEEEGLIDFQRELVLDRALSDFNTPKVLETLRHLGDGSGPAALLLDLLDGRVPANWPLPADEADAVARQALARATLNPEQRRAWNGVFERCLTTIWGPPGTGKTYLLAWVLIGHAVAARLAGRPCRILVTAATHRAVVNVLLRLAGEWETAGLSLPLRIAKLRGSGNSTDDDLRGTAVELLPDDRLPATLASADDDAETVVIGSTVWSLWKQMKAAGEEGPSQPWFDLIVVDEASQVKVAEALIALSAIRPGGRVVLCGDHRQLAPITRGRYCAEDNSLFGSAFEHFAQHFAPLALRRSRRMNRALVAYPRALFYPGLVSLCPEHRIGLLPPAAAEAPDDAERALDAVLLDAFLRPDDAVVLCTYTGIRAAARNAFEAWLAARLVRLARRRLLDPRTGAAFADAAFAARGAAVLCPHRAQNSAITAELRRAGFPAEHLPVVDTVERMQGNERELVLVSYAVADREYAEAEAEFLLDPNRFNVAITRARAKLIVLLSEEVLDALPRDERVMASSMAIKGYAAHCSDGSCTLELPVPRGGTVQVTCRYRRLSGTSPEAQREREQQCPAPSAGRQVPSAERREEADA